MVRALGSKGNRIMHYYEAYSIMKKSFLAFNYLEIAGDIIF